MVSEKLIELKSLIESGAKPIIHNCSGGGRGFSLGMLADLGWMRKRYTHDLEGEVDGWERDYFGPEPFMLETQFSTKLKEIKPNTTIY